jgi:hypothetical protein
MGTGSGFPSQVYWPCDIKPLRCGPGLPQDKDQRREISDLGLMQPALARPDPSAGRPSLWPLQARVREEIKPDHGVDLPRG